MDQLRKEFLHPSRQFTQTPFWFWNGDMNESELLRQIEAMEEKGVYGFVIHARMGLSEEIGYMTDRWLQLVKFTVEEAQKRDMCVYLYDEGMYPSGSAHGKVVEGRPDLASQGLRMIRETFAGPQSLQHSTKLENNESLVAAVLMQRDGESEKYISPSAKTLTAADPIEADIPAGTWDLFVFVQTPSQGVIRGVHWDEEDNMKNAPASADLLNPEAARRFIAATHEKYVAALSPFFGNTVRGIFTDEPNILGRRSRRGLKPWTTGFLTQANEILGYDLTPYLPFLWIDSTDGIERAVRTDFDYAVAQALNQHYYRLLSDWCADHGIASTGHPGGSGEMTPQVYFQEPGQDVVWRWVLPGKTSLEGEHSVIGKSASSMAVNLGRPMVINECYGAYGWHLTMDEMKWLADWLFVRGTNRLMPHAFYFSVADQRIYERPPDLSWFNLWWDHYSMFSDYTNRLSWLMTGGRPVADIAIFTYPGHTPWRAAKVLFQNQREFFYLDDSIIKNTKIAKGTIRIGDMAYSILVLDGVEQITQELLNTMQQCLAADVKIIAFDSAMKTPPLRHKNQEQQTAQLQQFMQNSNFYVVRSDEELIHILKRIHVPDLQVEYACPDLRFAHRIKEGIHLYLLVNEGEEPISANVTFPHNLTPEWWNAETGRMETISIYRTEESKTTLPFHLHPRESAIIAFTGAQDSTVPKRKTDHLHETETILLPDQGWTLIIDGKESDTVFQNVKLGPWNELPGMDSFSGTGCYAIDVDLSASQSNANQVVLDCGNVREWATVKLNGIDCGARLWRPFRFDITKAVRTGTNHVEIRVTNTRSNELTKEKLPSGLEGTVKLGFRK
jgi:hypothetical protein